MTRYTVARITSGTVPTNPRGRNIRPLIYKLDLSEYIKILYIWYILVLEPAYKNALLMINILDIDPESQDKV